ncbi:hypothetical protein Bca4012_075926 [Brassica carinata]
MAVIRSFWFDSCGEMLLVDMYLSMEEADGDPGFAEEVYEHQAVLMNERTVKEKSWVEVKDLGDRMLFLGDDCTFSASASALFPLRGGSSVFFCEDELGGMQGRDLGVFVFRNGAPTSGVYQPVLASTLLGYFS